MKKFSLSIAAAFLSAMLFAGAASAMTIGESALADWYKNSVDVYVDWIVYNPGTWSSLTTGTWEKKGSPWDPVNDYLYTYQLENPSAKRFSSTSLAIPALSVHTYGWVVDEDLDTAVTWNHNIGSEHELANLGIINPDNAYYVTDPADSKVQWTFFSSTGLPAKYESSVLYFTSPLKPTFSEIVIQDSTSQWHGAVPAPTPEPGTLALLAAIGGSFVFAAKRKNSQTV
ncbi:MAG: PEP-CTERM sorting domain-containing protein [Candidatus Schekmanbacteria bacterium]|nr:PEP-CTERM sorting domain-containing protein [Candidatus Schekmanbacteria bacterium]